MHIKDIDLNLLRLFDAVYRTRKVGLAAELLDLTQPAASQGLTRLRLLIKDPLFVRAGGGVQPTPRADRLAGAVRNALATLEQAFNESTEFEPTLSDRVFKLHLSDIGEARLPEIMAALRSHAPGVQLQSQPLASGDIAAALDSGSIDFALGFLPAVQETQHVQLLQDRYIVMLRDGHPFTRKKRSGQALLGALQELDFVAVRTHSDTLRILQLLELQDRLRLVAEHFMALPSIVKATDLAVVIPRNLAKNFAQEGGYALIEPPFPLRDFKVALHWSKRFENDSGNRWLRQLLVELFLEKN